MRVLSFLAVLAANLVSYCEAQQYAGDVIPNSLGGVPGSEITYWKILDGKKNNLTLINYINHGSDGQRLVPSVIKRAVIIIHGLNRDPGTYESNMLSALSQVDNPDITTDTVAIVAPYFANGDDKNTGYPWVNGLPSGQGSTSNCLVWKGSQWSAGGNCQYPSKGVVTSSYTVLDQMIQYFDNATMFPNINQIVVAGHSLGGQTVQRYAALGNQLNTRTPVSYWVANPNSYVWLSTNRPLSTTSCPTYDYYREGYTNFTDYPMTYGQTLVTSGRATILANFNSRAINYARGTSDLGDDSSSCAPFTTGANRNERFFNFIQAFPTSCSDSTGRNCDTVDLIAAGHDGGAMMGSSAGIARLFTDNFYGNGIRAYDFGYPRQQVGDDPFPNPSLNSSSASVNNNTYAGNMTYWGCWSDQTPRTLANLTYDNGGNTIELCTQTCAQGGSTVAALEAGSQCFCGSSLNYAATQVIDSSCGTPCTGNSSEICGGANRMSLFSNGQPVVNPAPGTPETVGSGFTYSNCYTEATRGRALSATSTSGSFMTLEYCASFCSAYQFFGTEYANECYCGNSLGAGATIAISSDCFMTCAADNIEYCGAGNRLTVYQNTSWLAPSSTSASTSNLATSTGSAATVPAASATASGAPQPPVSCPISDGSLVTSNGSNFTIECGIDHQGGDLTSLSVGSFLRCIQACAQNPACVDLSLSGSACYLKSSVGPPVNNGVWGARLLSSTPSSDSSTTSTLSSTSTLSTSTLSTSSRSTSSGSAASASSQSATASTPSTTVSASTVPSTSSSAGAITTPVSCPNSNNTMVTSYGLTFLIECGIDHRAGDLTSLGVSSFQQCIDACAQNSACQDVSLSGSACYLKSSVGAAVNNGVWGARLVAGSSPSSSSSSSSTSVSTASSASTTSILSTSTTALTSSASVDATSSDSNAASSTTTLSSSTSASSPSLTSATATSTTSPSPGPLGSSDSSSGTSSSTVPTPSGTTFVSTTSTSTSASASASATKLSCPDSNNTLYTASQGNTFQIECGVDHYAGDMGMVYVSNFTQCVNACDSTAGCVNVALSGVACYLKRNLGAAISNAGILGAKLVTPAAASGGAAATDGGTT